MDSVPWFMELETPVTTNFAELWARTVQRFGSTTAVCLPNEPLTFRELDERAWAIAEQIQRTPGWQPGDMIALPCCNQTFLSSFLGVWLAKGVVVPFTRSSLGGDSRPSKHIGNLVGWMLEDKDHAGSTEETPSVSKFLKPSRRKHNVISAGVVGGWHGIYFTSGSTGTPRAVVRGWRQALYEAGQYARVLQLGPGMSCAMLIEPSFGASTKHLLGCLLAGCLQSFPNFGAMAVAAGDVLYGTPAQMIAFASRTRDRIGRGYRLISLTGESCSAAAWRAVHELAGPGGRCLNALGGTEFGVALNHLWTIDGPLPAFQGEGLPSKALAIVDENGRHCPAGEPGLLRVASNFLAEGYLDADEETLRLVEFDRDEQGRRCVFTGDVVVEDSGVIRHVGRSGKMLKYRGKWLDTGGLAATLRESPDVREFAIDLSSETSQLRVWLEPARFEPACLDRVCALLTERFGDGPLLPAEVIALRALPRNHRGKVDLARLAQLKPNAKAGNFMLRNPEGRIQQLARSILKGRFPSPEDRLADYRLDSLALQELALVLENHLGRTLSLASLLKDVPVSMLRQELLDDQGVGLTQLGRASALGTLFWFGGGIGSIKARLADKVRIFHWDYDVALGNRYLSRWPRIEQMTRDLLGMPAIAAESGPVFMGGFSFGALLAQEAGRQWEASGRQVAACFLVDPPKPSLGLRRSTKRWLRSPVLMVCGALVPWSVVAKRVPLLQSLQRYLRREARRRVLLRHQPRPSCVPTWLFTTERYHSQTPPLFKAALRRLEVVPLGVERHIGALRQKKALACWLGMLEKVCLTLADPGSRNEWTPFVVGNRHASLELVKPPDVEA